MHRPSWPPISPEGKIAGICNSFTTIVSMSGESAWMAVVLNKYRRLQVLIRPELIIKQN